MRIAAKGDEEYQSEYAVIQVNIQDAKYNSESWDDSSELFISWRCQSIAHFYVQRVYGFYPCIFYLNPGEMLLFFWFFLTPQYWLG